MEIVVAPSMLNLVNPKRTITNARTDKEEKME